MSRWLAVLASMPLEPNVLALDDRERHLPGIMSPDVRVAVSYTWIVLPVWVLTILVSVFSIAAANALPMRVGALWFGIALNVLPAAAVGFLCYRWAAAFWRPRTPARSRHWIRAAPLYALALAIATLVAIGMHDPSFGLIGQLIVWPGVATIGGIAGELVGWRRSRSPTTAG